jgi:hypothetical protein
MKTRSTAATKAFFAAVLFASTVGAKDVPTTCQDICSTYTSTLCVVTAVKDIVGGSVVDCTTARDIRLEAGSDLRVHDATFVLRGKSLVSYGGLITADCPQAFERIGFRVETSGAITFVTGSGAKMSARCSRNGGTIALNAGGNVTVDALGIDASGSTNDAPGGTIDITSGGTVTLRAPLSAEATGGEAEGGDIHVQASTISVKAELRVKGYGGSSVEQPGGEITLQAANDVTITDGAGLNAESALGGGGTVTIEAGNVVDVQKPIRTRGTSGSAGMGGSIDLSGAQVKVDNDLIAIGGRDGGTIRIEATGAGVQVGTGGQATTLDVTANNAGKAGTIAIEALGSHVTIGSQAVLRANGSGGGSAGGLARLTGVDVVTNSGSNVYANGAPPDQGGVIEVESRGVLTLAGGVQANNGGSLTFVQRSGTPSISGGITGYDLVQDSSLAAPCGDGIRLAGSEDCDGGDLGGQTCASQGHGTGSLACSPTCTFDFTACSS